FGSVQCGVFVVRHRGIKSLRIDWIDNQCGHWRSGVSSEESLARVVVGHGNGSDLTRIGKDEMPSTPAITAAPKSETCCVDHVVVLGIENKEVYLSAKVERTPREASIIGNIGASHIAGHQNPIGIVWTDRRRKQRATSPRPDRYPMPALGWTPWR